MAYLMKEYHHVCENEKVPFIPGVTRVPVSGKVFNYHERIAIVDAALEFWLTAGKYASEFEQEFSARLGARHGSFVNSGSSANLLAVTALTSSLIDKEYRLNPGDEVITVAACFPTTVAPIVQVGAVPVFVDIDVDDGTYNANVEQLRNAITNKTKAVILAHTLGNPFDVESVLSACESCKIWLIEDCCDAFCSIYHGEQVGNFGCMSTFSFYPAHHITTGEGGMVCTSDTRLNRIVKSFRDWGRDCHCHTGEDNACGHRFDRSFGTLPKGYDHKSVCQHLGYNLKATDMQAAIGLAQLDKLDDFIEKRKSNWNYLSNGLSDLEDKIVLPKPTPKSDPSWFGFLITVREGISRDSIVSYLEKHKIQTRPLFAGNITRHPCFTDGRYDYRIASKLANTDRAMNDTFWVGVYPGLTKEMLDYTIEQIHNAVGETQ